MKATDLRSGNYVKADKLQVPRWGLFGSDYMAITAYGISLIEADIYKPEPIPLTNDWLDRFGFGLNIPETARWVPGNDDFVIGVQDGRFYCSEFSGSSDEPTVRHFFELEYVHSLQNAFYIFEGQELTLK